MKENRTFRVTAPRAERILGKEIKCLDKGFVRLVDYMGNDTSIVQAARVSYGKGTKKVSTDRALIDYLLRHHHTTPFEMVEFKFHTKMPIFVARQWVRHRTANINEISGRYSVLDDDFYLPKSVDIGLQSKINRQGRGELASREVQKKFIEWLKENQIKAYNQYEELINEGLARELARIGLPLNIYTQWYWKIDLHNLFHFLKLRLDARAQKEIRVFAEAMAKCVKAVVPWAWNSFENHILKGKNLAQDELETLGSLAQGKEPLLSSRRLKEFKEKFDKDLLKKLDKKNLVDKKIKVEAEKKKK